MGLSYIEDRNEESFGRTEKRARRVQGDRVGEMSRQEETGLAPE